MTSTNSNGDHTALSALAGYACETCFFGGKKRTDSILRARPGLGYDYVGEKTVVLCMRYPHEVVKELTDFCGEYERALSTHNQQLTQLRKS